MLDFMAQGLPSVIGLILGAWVRYMGVKIQAEEKRNEMFINALAAKEITIENARRFDTPHTSWARKFIVLTALGSLFAFPMLITLLNWLGHILENTWMPWLEYKEVLIYIPQEIVKGGIFTWFYKDETTEYLALNGFVILPIHFFMAQLIGCFYLGQGGIRGGNTR